MDFDGDTVRLIGLFSDDANMEASRLMKSPMNFLDASGRFTRGASREAGLSLFMMTRDE